MMRGASAEAQAVVDERLGEVLSDQDEAGQVGTDLFGIAGLLRSEPGLRRVVTDGAIQADAKEDLARQVFEGKVSSGSLSLAVAAVRQRWTAGRDLADALEHLGVVAVVKSAGDSAEQLEDELFEVSQLVGGAPQLRDALSDPARSLEDKRALVQDLLGGKASLATIALVEQALSGSYRTVGVALHEYQKVAADVRGQRVATVRVAQAMSEQEEQRLADALSQQYDRPVHLNIVIDPEVIGGIRVEIADDVIDGTVASRLDAARRKLAG